MVDDLFSIPFGARSPRASAKNPDRPIALDRFVAGPENRLAAVAVQSVLDRTNPQFNPMLFCGPVGAGKSHLAWGLASTWKARFHHWPAIYTYAQEFAQELNDAIDAQTVDDFRGVYRRVCLLVIEDLERLAERACAQIELVDTIDALLDQGARVVLTAHLPPADLGLDPRLLSRIAQGLIVPLALPGPDARLAIVQRAAEARGMPLPEASARLLAETPGGGATELFGALTQLELAARAEGSTLEVESVRRLLARRTAAAEPSLQRIATTTARHFSLRVAQLQSPSRTRAVVTARGVAMYLARHMTHRSLEQIGHYFGGRDHTTVSHGCRKTEELLQTEPAVRQAVLDLRERLKETG